MVFLNICPIIFWIKFIVNKAANKSPAKNLITNQFQAGLFIIVNTDKDYSIFGQ